MNAIALQRLDSSALQAGCSGASSRRSWRRLTPPPALWGRYLRYYSPSQHLVIFRLGSGWYQTVAAPVKLPAARAPFTYGAFWFRPIAHYRTPRFCLARVKPVPFDSGGWPTSGFTCGQRSSYRFDFSSTSMASLTSAFITFPRASFEIVNVTSRPRT